MQKNNNKNRTIIHVEYKGNHSYYGCIREVFDHFSAEQIGMPYSTFSKKRRVSFDSNYVSKDGVFIMRKGIVVSRKSIQEKQSISQNHPKPVAQGEGYAMSSIKIKSKAQKHKVIEESSQTITNLSETELYDTLGVYSKKICDIIDDIINHNALALLNVKNIEKTDYKSKLSNVKKFYTTLADPNGINSYYEEEVEMKEYLNNNKERLNEFLNILTDTKGIDIRKEQRDEIKSAQEEVERLVFQIYLIRHPNMRLF